MSDPVENLNCWSSQAKVINPHILRSSICMGSSVDSFGLLFENCRLSSSSWYILSLVNCWLNDTKLTTRGQLFKINDVVR